MALETTNTNLSAKLTRCDKCTSLRTHSTQRGFEQHDGTIDWREEINGCARHPAEAEVVRLDGTKRPWPL